MHKTPELCIELEVGWLERDVGCLERDVGCLGQKCRRLNGVDTRLNREVGRAGQK
jgi:hypothetical protein